MKFSMTIIFSLLFLVVLVVYLNLDPSKLNFNQEEASKPEAVRVLPLSESDEVTRIQIQNRLGQETVTLAKKAGNWMLEFPVQAPADPMLAEGLVASLKLSNQIRRMSPEKKWEEYGLKEPQLKVGVDTKEGKSRRYLLFGHAAPIGENVFAKWDGEKEYFLVARELKAAFSQSVYSIRMKRVFQMPLKEIQKIHFRVKNEDFEISQHKGKWFWMEPILLLGEPMEPMDTQMILSKVENLNVKEFLDGDPPPAVRTGFSLLSDSIKVSNEQKKEETLDLGVEVAARDAFYARSTAHPTFLISKSYLSDFFEDLKLRAAELVQKSKQNRVA